MVHDAQDISREQWIAECARLIRCRDEHMSPDDADSLATSFHNRPCLQTMTPREVVGRLFYDVRVPRDMTL